MTLSGALATPDGKRRYTRQVFATIADRYDLITRILSFGFDPHWKRQLVTLAGLGPKDRVLDLACGTGDLAYMALPSAERVVGLDLTHRMLVLARQKAPTARRIRFLTGDMTALPFPDAAFTVVTTGYGLRNVPDLPLAIAEARRVLVPGGRLLSLDFNRPDAPFVRAVYLGYLQVVGGILGWLLHRDPDTYRYIPETIRRYPGAEGVARLLREGGFERVRALPVLGGLMTIHVAHRPA
ncbi:MAG: ubiquinone/menaquinone biosynthesis methyltransferase [Vicinamibacterales bacterium]|nr:ubiquinone/menaquinone biosynthesis methyltransferase [Vicinamibacterales bacterium]